MKTGRKNRVLYTMLAAVLGASIVFPRQALSPRAAAEETDISAIGGLQVHLDAQSIAGVNNGAAVEKVENKAASTLQGAGDAVQTNTARRPAYIAQGRINGKPALRFQANSCMPVSYTHLEQPHHVHGRKRNVGLVDGVDYSRSGGRISRGRVHRIYECSE